MNQKNARDYIPLLEALADGELQWFHYSGGWGDIKETNFSDAPKTYRRKPKPQKLYVATWFLIDHYVEGITHSNREYLVERYKDRRGFKLHELDCGEEK